MVFKSSLNNGGGGGSGTVQSVTGLNTNNTDPANPIVQISVDGVTITGAGTPASPLVSSGGSGITLKTDGTPNSDQTTLNLISGTNVTLTADGAGGVTIDATGGGGGSVVSVSGTANRITSTGGTTPIIDIAATYVGQTSITTLGTIATGVWQGTKVGLAYGGTNADLSGTGGASQVLKQSSAGAAITVGQLAAADLSDGTTGSGSVVLATSPMLVTPALGTPSSGNLANCTFPTLNQNTTGSAASLSISGQTGLLTFTGLTSTNRAKTVRDAADTILELGGSYTPSGTWNWTTATVTWPTFNQNTTGSAAKWTTPRTLGGNSVDGSINVAFANKFIVQGTVDAGLSAAQFLGALGTGIVKNTTTTGVLSIAVAADFPTLNQNTTGSAATLTTPRSIGGVSFDGSANIVPQTIESANEATDTTCFPLFITASGTQQLQPKNSTSLTYDSTTGAFSATSLGGTLTTAAQTNITSVGTLTGGATGAGFTVALGTSTVSGILTSANGGTGNGFTKFSGPATSEKTFTLPNANATVLTSNAAVTVAQGGTGLATLTANAVMLGNGNGNVGFATIGTAGRLLIDQGAAANPAFTAMSQDATISSSGAITLAASTYNAVPSAQVVTVTSAASPYTIGANDYVILVDTSGGAVTLNLPSPVTKKRIKIKDSTGNFGTNNCTVARNGTEQIEGIASSLILRANWGNYEFQSNGTNWFKTSGSSNLASITYGTAGGTLVCPAGVTQMIISGRGGSGGGGGGGAGGGGSTGAGAAGGGGGGSGGSVYTVTKAVTVVPNTSYTATVGAGGTVGSAGTVTTANAAGSTGGNGGVGGNGGSTSFGSLFSVPGGFGGGPANGGQLAAVGTGGYAGEGVYYGVAGANGGLANASGSNTTQQFIFTPWAADAATANGTGGSAGGASGGGGGGAGGIPAPGDGAQPNGVTAGSGGASGANGATGTAINAAANGVGGQGGTGGGGGGLKAATGTQGGAGKAGGIGVDGFLTVSWQE